MKNASSTYFSSLKSPLIIAEISANHNGDIELAKRTISAAKESGADAVKLQTYTADTMTLDVDNDDFTINSGPWAGYRMYDLYNQAQTPYEWHEKLFEFASNIGIKIFSTPFDETAVDLLESLESPIYKVASFEITDLFLLKKIGSTKKPVIISTGMASLAEIGRAIEVLNNSGASDICVLHCISSYPALTLEANLNNIKYIKNRFRCHVGLSDHTMDNVSVIASVALGAIVIEKHFILDRSLGGVDSHFSIEPDEFRDMVEVVRTTAGALGGSKFSRPQSEFDMKKFRRSLYFARDLQAGVTVRDVDVARVRPGFGLDLSHYDDVIGSETIEPVTRGERISLHKLKLNRKVN